MSKLVRFLVLSDLHAIDLDVSENDGEIKKDSKLYFEEGHSDYANEFLNFVDSLKLDLDFLVCCGDISNRCCTSSFKRGWEFLLDLKDKIGVKDIISVPGNHDHQSRQDLEKVYCPKHHMQFLKPSFPTNSFKKNTQFWAWNWCHLEYDNCNFILLNSSAYHGYKDEYQHGRVSIEVIDQISDFVKSDDFKHKNINVLVCHHHPEKMGYVDKDYDTQAMEGGSDLMFALDSADKGQWLILHGHKHFSDVSFARGHGLCTPLIFAAGSFSANLYPIIENRTSNQFYIVEVDLDATSEYGRLSGGFKTFEWRPRSRWSPSTSDNLPAEGGFGGGINVQVAYNNLERKLKDTEYLVESELKDFNEEIKYLTPSDFKSLQEKLRTKGFDVTSRGNRLIEIGGPK